MPSPRGGKRGGVGVGGGLQHMSQFDQNWSSKLLMFDICLLTGVRFLYNPTHVLFTYFDCIHFNYMCEMIWNWGMHNKCRRIVLQAFLTTFCLCGSCCYSKIFHLHSKSVFTDCFFFSTSGGIQSTPVPAKFSFEVTAKIEVLCVHVSYSVAINCKTNDPSANVSLSLPKHLPSHNLPSLQGRLKRNGAIFTIQKAILHDGGKYYCVAEKNGKVIKREIYLYVAGTCGIFHSYIL